MALIISKQILIEHLLGTMHCSWHITPSWSYFQQVAAHINIIRQLFRNVIRCEYYEAKKNVKPEVGVKGRHSEGET